MTIKEANKELVLTRKKREAINAKIKSLNEFLVGKHADPSSLIKKRNQQIYKMYLKGKPFEVIAIRYSLTPARIKEICQRIYRQKFKGIKD